MPSYLYLCPIHNEFEEIHSIKDEAKLIYCPTCKSENNIDTPVERLISGGSGKGIVVLYGQDMVNKVKEDAVQFKKDVHKDEKLYASVLGESRYQQLQQNIDKNKGRR